MRELIYWNQMGVLFLLDGLTLLQRNILGMIAGTRDRGLYFHDREIAHQFKVTEGAVVTALKILREKDYITTSKKKSPHRKLFASEKTNAIVQKALDEAKIVKNKKATHTNGMGVENSTHTNGGGVTHINGRGVLPIHLGECIINKETNQTIGGANAPKIDESFSASLSHGSNPRKTRAPFVPPTTAEVQDYAQQVGHTLLAAHPEKFVRHYEAAVPPWTKTNGKPVKNWKQTLLNWRDNGQGDDVKPKKSLEWPDPPAEVIAEDFRRAREASL